jgi:hypothetical protein
MHSDGSTSRALVTVVVAPRARPDEMPLVVRSVLAQTHARLQVIVAAADGENARAAGATLAAVRDDRLVLLPPTGKPARAEALNRALAGARGQCVCYLDDRQVYYPHHVRCLLEALDGPTDCDVAYSDACRVTCRRLTDGRRQVLAKTLRPSRDFDRFFLLHYGDAPLGCVMHRRELLERTGPFNRELDALLDWDLLRRMSFYSDFVHVAEPTSEYACWEQADAPQDDDGSHANRPARELLAVRTTRPPKPWPKMKDLAVILAPRRMDAAAAGRVRAIGRWIFPPCRLFLAGPPDTAGAVGEAVGNLTPVAVEASWPWDARVDRALRHCEGDLVAICPPELDVSARWIEMAVYALWHSARPNEAIALGGPGRASWGGVFRTPELRAARRAQPALSIRRSVEAGGIRLRPIAARELPFGFDRLRREAETLGREGNWLLAARLHERNARLHGNELWMRHRAAADLYREGNHDRQALEICQAINQARPTVDSLLLEAAIHRRQDRCQQAIERLLRAQEILDWQVDPNE